MYELSIVIPTYNERNNVLALVNALKQSLQDIKWEVLFIDDNSPDGTAAYIRNISSQNDNIRLIQRLHKKGLASACIDGFLACSSPYVAVMDADMQHDEHLLVDMLGSLRMGEADIVIGSRYMEGGGTGKLDKARVLISQVASYLGNIILKQDISDPMSGYFMFARERLAPYFSALSGMGFKILLDILATTRAKLRIKEMPYVMRVRQSGSSKFATDTVLQYLLLLLDKTAGRYIPLRFIMFSLVGGSGIVVHLCILALFYHVLKWEFIVAQSFAVWTAMSSNFALNNIFTYKDKKLTGKKFIYGLFSFYLICIIGAFANVTFANFLYAQGIYWPIAGAMGLLLGSVWNFAVSSIVTWRN